MKHTSINAGSANDARITRSCIREGDTLTHWAKGLGRKSSCAKIVLRRAAAQSKWMPSDMSHLRDTIAMGLLILRTEIVARPIAVTPVSSASFHRK
ncbi:MAG: hypothetical protein L0Z50_13550 [Verrucomicrobiales bacterium]|nr:hypothetical protein [Verrucomicrobiales bacterium]